ncbi:MAG: hypothetical protein ACUVRD_06915 [Bacteroidia bacterium]
MNRLISLAVLGALLVVPLGGCKKEKKTQEGTGKITLVAEQTTIRVGQTTIITAEVQNFEPVSYSWSVNTSSNLTALGNGNQAKLYPHCGSCVGKNVVSCRAKNASGQEITGSIEILVEE